MALIDMHSSWLVVNSVVGCTNACKYCLWQDSNNNLCSPKILGTPKQEIEELLNFKYYDQSLPLYLFPNTDIFLNESNIEYLMNTLDELDKNNIQNDLILITKCLIPSQVLSRLKQIQDIDTALEVIVNNQSAIGNIYSKGKIRECSVNKKWFDPAFINNGVFISLLQQAQFYSSN